MSQQQYSLLTLIKAASGAVTDGRFVGHDGATATAGGNALGVARADAADGEDCPVDVLGTAVVEAGAAIGDGGEIEVGADGKAIPVDTGTKVARALEAANGDGHKIEILPIPN